MRVELPVMSAFFINAKERSTESGRKRKLKNAEAKKNWKIQKLRNGEIDPPTRWATPAGLGRAAGSENREWNMDQTLPASVGGGPGLIPHFVIF
jgi:hypothetical protein